MSVWFTSDLHLGHRGVLKWSRAEFKEGDIDYHDFTIIENINSWVNKRDKLYILGDLAFSDRALQRARDINCENIELILGNHDTYPIHKYMSMGMKLHGFRGYKNFWLSHCPIHPSEMRKKTGNIHGHIHRGGDTAVIDDPRYFNVNIELHKYLPVPFDKIKAHFNAINKSKELIIMETGN
ncbi:MAG: hypothetical protein GY941_12015, partial [Planctomycetes bacterium]|nr:hypothetical protein [Planctomycetota bacterium]